MIIDGIRVADDIQSPSPAKRAVAAFMQYIERALDVIIVRDATKYPHYSSSVEDAYTVAETLQRHGILTSFRTVASAPDEPRLFRFEGIAGGVTAQRSGGASFRSEETALYAMSAETLERYLWSETKDYFRQQIRATERALSAYSTLISPTRFVGISEEQRKGSDELQLRDDVEYLWIRGDSLTRRAPIYLPAQTVSGHRGLRRESGRTEPLIRKSITTGLATYPDQTEARLRGALEAIERDAYMIMWLNQLTLPRINLKSVCTKSSSLSELVATCDRYGFNVHAVRLITDAPAYVVCVVIEDRYGNTPRYAFGLKAGRSLADTIEGALTEGLRMRTIARSFALEKPESKISPDEVGHSNRLQFWALREDVSALEFITAGSVANQDAEPWDLDSSAQHLERIVSWCISKGYECACVSLSTKANNPLPWYVEMVVIPELQPLYLFESDQMTGGTRLRTIPEQFGYASRTPFTKLPHPFA